MGYALDGFCYANATELLYGAQGKIGEVVGNTLIVSVVADTGVGENALEFFFESTTGVMSSMVVQAYACAIPGPVAPEFAIEPELIQLGAMAILSLWAAGLGVGLLLSQVRKLRSP